MNPKPVIAVIVLPPNDRKEIERSKPHLQSRQGTLHWLPTEKADIELRRAHLPNPQYLAILRAGFLPDDNLIDRCLQFLEDNANESSCTVPVQCSGKFQRIWRVRPTVARVFLEAAPPFLMIRGCPFEEPDSVVLNFRRIDPLADLALKMLSKNLQITVLEEPLLVRHISQVPAHSHDSWIQERLKDLIAANSELWQASCEELIAHQVTRFHQASDSLNAIRKKYLHLSQLVKESTIQKSGAGTDQ